MNEVTWRTYLGNQVRRMSSEEKRRFYLAVGVNRTSILRWRSGTDTPKAANLARLLTVFPGERKDQFLDLLQDDPKVRSLLPVDVLNPSGSLPQDSIPSSVYAKILREGRSAADRFWWLCETVLKSALAQLDPQQEGMEIVVARCMPPGSDGKIRSLREDVAIGTPPWRGDLHHKERFLGAESLAGYACSSRHGEMVPDLRDTTLVPVHPMEHERSAVAYPIMRERCLAGALIVSSAQISYFTPQRLALIEAYTDLVCLAFYDRDFYDVSYIDLCLMPAWQVQQTYVDTFRQRVEEEYRKSLQSGRRELAQVEQDVRGLLEEELLHLVRSPGEIAHT
jgi:hypothetical protein